MLNSFFFSVCERCLLLDVVRCWVICFLCVLCVRYNNNNNSSAIKVGGNLSRMHRSRDRMRGLVLDIVERPLCSAFSTVGHADRQRHGQTITVGQTDLTTRTSRFAVNQSMLYFWYISNSLPWLFHLGK